MKVILAIAALAGLAHSSGSDSSSSRGTKPSYEPSIGSCGSPAPVLLELCLGSLMFCAFGHYKDNNETYTSGQACALDRGIVSDMDLAGIVDKEAYESAVSSLRRADEKYQKYHELVKHYQKAITARKQKQHGDGSGRSRPDRSASWPFPRVQDNLRQAEKAIRDAKQEIGKATVPDVAQEVWKMIDQARLYADHAFLTEGLVEGYFMNVHAWIVKAMDLDD